MSDAFKVGDRVRNIRLNRFGRPNGLPPATVVDVCHSGTTIWIKYDDDTDDVGWFLIPQDLVKLA